MDDREFFDALYQLWSKTTNASDRFWDYQPDDKHAGLFKIGAVGEDGGRADIAWGLYEADADFITGVHGCFADLVHRLGEAVDEADRLDIEVDVCHSELAEAELRLMEFQLEAQEYRQIIQNLSQDPPWHQRG